MEVAVQRMRETKFVGMEYFGSRDETTQRASLDEVNRSHVYVGIIGGSYGSGITKDEYRRARERPLPCFIYFKREASILPENLERDAEKAKLLDAFKAELRSHTTTDFANPDDLAARVTADLHRWLFDNYLPAQLEGALRGTISQTEAQSLVKAIKDSSPLNHELLARLRVAGFIVAGDVVHGDKDVVHGDKIVYQTAPPPTFNALHQLPSPPRDFTGREDELEELMRAFEQVGITIYGLQGLGGVGKTALALKLAQLLTPRYPDAQLYLDLKGLSKPPLRMADAMAHVIHAYQPTIKLPGDEAELGALYRSVLHNQRALLLMDNAADRKQVEPLIPSESCLMLLTSRRRFALPGLFTKNLDALPAEDSRKLLLKIAPHIGEQADTIAKLCGYLPLPLRLAASALVEQIDRGVEDYVQRLTNAQQLLKLIDASLSLSYELLSPDMQELWRLLATFPNTFDVAAATAVWGIEPDAAQEALSELVKYSLLEWNKTIARYRLHDLSRLFANDHLNEDELSKGQRRHASHYLRMIREADKLYLQGGEALKRGLVLFDLEWPNIQAGQGWAEKHAREDNVAASLCNDYPSAGAHLLHILQHPGERIRWLKSALTAARRLKKRVDEGWHLNRLGIVYWALGEMRQALKQYKQQLVIARELGDRPLEGYALGGLGWSYYALGETHQAIRLYKQYLTIIREFDDRYAESHALRSLGQAYFKLGEIDRAIEFNEQALVIVREINYRRGEGIALGSLGWAYTALGETRRAIELCKQSLLISREIGDRRSEGDALWNLSLIFDELGKRDETIAHAEAALEIYEQIELPQAAMVRKKLAEWRGQGDDA